MIHKIIIYLICNLFIHSFIFPQPDLRFHPFDWVQYRKTGKINSISFSDRYAFMATENGGILRFNLFSERFEEPITKAQGLKSNTIYSVHYASNGYLWVGTPLGIEFSYNSEGDWNFINKRNLKIPLNSMVEQIGESEQDIWIKTNGSVYRLDRITGVVLDVMTFPNELVSWSSQSRFLGDYSSILMNFSILDGWISDLFSLIDPNGNPINISTIHNSPNGEVWIGAENGYIFRGNKTMKTLSPYQFSLAGTDVQYIEGKNSFWIGGQSENGYNGITLFEPLSKKTYMYLFENIINMDRTSIYSIIDLKNEIWFAGNDVILTYNKNNNYWRTQVYDITNLNPSIGNFTEFDDKVWLGTDSGLFIFNKKGKTLINDDITNFFSNIFIFDLFSSNEIVFLATEIGLYIYDKKNNKIYEGKNFGYYEDDFIFPIRTTGYTALASNKRNFFAANQSGIISFNFRTRKWSNAVDASIFGGLRIKSLASDKEIMFIATINGLIKYDMKKNLMDTYNYPFIGQVNHMYIKGRKLWLGTSEGLISYKFK